MGRRDHRNCIAKKPEGRDPSGFPPSHIAIRKPGETAYHSQSAEIDTG